MNNNILVLGAGLTGLSFALHLDKSTLILEKEATPGGLVRTIKERDYYFDLAPHLIHLRTDYVKNLLFDKLNLKLNAIERVSNIFFENKIMPYPFELHLSKVSDKVRSDCLKGLDHVRTLSDSEHIEYKKGSYKEYVTNCFGEGIGNHYLFPYNEKIWTITPSEMSCEWMRFLPTADKKLILDTAKQGNKLKFGYNTEFYYPYSKGIQELPDSIANQLDNIEFNSEVKRINTNRKIVTTKEGKEYSYNKLISTLPLNQLILNSDLDDLKQAASKLINTSVNIINVVIEGEMVENFHWTYFPDKRYNFYRISYPKSYFENATSSKNEFICSIEVAYRDNEPDVQELNKTILTQLQTFSFLRIKKVKQVFNYKIPIAYSIYDFNRTRLVETLKKELIKRDIISIGRYGSWNYSAMEDAIIYGKEAAKNI